jgi:hypothetical protein
MKKTDTLRTVQGLLRQNKLLPAAPPVRRMESSKDRERKRRLSSRDLLKGQQDG